MIIAEELKKLIGQTGVQDAKGVKLEHPVNLAFGDYACFIAGPASASSLSLRATAGKKADELAAKINESKPEWLEKVEVVGAFVNFYLSPKFFAESIAEINKEKNNFGTNQKLAGQKTIVEYTDPNPFKEFHIGHLMSNTVGESISRLIVSQGAEVKRACYQGDVGLHVAKAVWGLKSLNQTQITSKVLGEAYAFGAVVFATDDKMGVESDGLKKKEIIEINKKLYERNDEEVNKIYDEGRKISLEYFETIYKKLGTKFDFYFFESKTGPFGKKIVEEGLEKGIFEKSDGAVVFKGDEKEGLHTRVFINSEGLPTYEAKELGLAKIKYDGLEGEYEPYHYDCSIVITGNEINAYFKVLLKVMSLLFPELAAKTKHLSHGMLRLPTGKMSSRTGDVITAEAILSEINQKIIEKTKEVREGKSEISQDDVEHIPVAALKYSILRQSPGKDIIFDFDKSLSFEGDSGPYLQYTCVRAKSVLDKAVGEKISGGPTLRESKVVPPESVSSVEKLLYRFPEIVERAATDYAPNHLVTYLTELASAFNSYYAQNKIIGSDEESYRLALTAAVAQVLENGLNLLGITVPSKM